ncbi:neuropeptide natalisin [Arctopsyche grandis]|uniref:neuropeptide natalisin n=1 Tax=Arctopsyche grandis TaxID=121162 RepID=UPI00406D8F71
MRQPFLLGAFVYIALVAGRISNGNGLKTPKDAESLRNRPQGIKINEIATANPIIRAKRVTKDPEDVTFWANRGRRGDASLSRPQIYSFPESLENIADYVENVQEWPNEKQLFEELFVDNKGKKLNDATPTTNDANKINCPSGCNNRNRREEVAEPFWGTRGRRNEETNIFWGNRGRRSEPDSPFWGNRGKKSESGPFWGNRGKKEADIRDKKNPEDLPFWGNRGKRDDGPFWGNRGRRASEEVDFNPFWGNRGKKNEIEPFWGNRGRRNDPFWGNRGKKDNGEPFWGNRGKKDDTEPFWGNRGKKEDAEPFWGNRGKKDDFEPFWGNRGKRFPFNYDFFKDPQFLELIDTSKCFSKYLNGLFQKERGIVTPEEYKLSNKHKNQKQLDTDNILIYGEDELN